MFRSLLIVLLAVLNTACTSKEACEDRDDHVCFQTESADSPLEMLREVEDADGNLVSVTTYRLTTPEEVWVEEYQYSWNCVLEGDEEALIWKGNAHAEWVNFWTDEETGETSEYFCVIVD